VISVSSSVLALRLALAKPAIAEHVPSEVTLFDQEVGNGKW
jgi:hypothetical protein